MAAAAKKQEKPQGEWLSESAIAKKVGLHRQTLAARLEDLGYEPDEERSGPKLKVYWFDGEMEFAVKAAKDSLSAAKIRDVRAAAQLKELKLAEARRDLVPAAEMVEIVQKIVANLYQEHIIRQPKRIAAKLAKAKSVTQVKKILKVDEDRIMKSLRENFERFLG